MRKTSAIMIAASISTSLQAWGATPLTVNENNPVVSENFDSMWDSLSGEATLTLPEGWAIDRNLSAPRTVGAWNEASSTLMYSGGTSLASNAKNGTWNFGDSSSPSDRAIGGLTTTVNNGTRGVSLMTAITNDGTQSIDRLSISYNVEKYRRGANAAGFAVQLYKSEDGVNWSPAGDNFRTFFTADNETLGAENVPFDLASVANADILADVAPGETLYLAWNISVASGSTPDKAQGLAIDDIVISAKYSSPDAHKIFIEKALKGSDISIYSSTADLFGPAPGVTTNLTKSLNGVVYRAWEMPGTSTFDLYVNAGQLTLGPVQVNGEEDIYLCAAPDGLSVITDPETYSGWIDPSRPPFTPSGIYLRGEVNSWGASADWEFSKEDEGLYVMYDKEISGQFKIADANWSSSCNYGSNGSTMLPDTQYPLVSGTDSNISCGNYSFVCKRIILSITSDGSAILMLESDDDDTGLTQVYMVGDFNNWNFMDASGLLTLDEADNFFKGQVTMKSGADGMSHWRLYQRKGMGGAWGLADHATEPSLTGNLVKGETGNAAINPGTYNVTFSLSDGAYSFEAVESRPDMLVLDPANVILTPENPEHVKVLSLNNSLIHYNDQDFVFNDIANAMGVDASWTKHTNLGKPLSYHWSEGDGLAEDGTPGAKMMIRSEAWSHIILQEQSALPRTNPETFRANVKQWIDYVREYCPNPNAVIILPVNWGYSSDWGSFNEFNRQFMEVYTDIATEMGAVVCPVASAYDAVYSLEGSESASTWFSDDRHPTLKATYMAACMEFAAITGMDPADITYTPAGLSAEESADMRKYASMAWNGYVNAIDHRNATVDFSAKVYDDFGMVIPSEVTYSVDGGGSVSDTGLFVSDGTPGTYTVTARSGEFEKKATVTVTSHETVVITYPAIEMNEETLSVSEDFDSMGTDATASLPEAWRIDRQTVGTRMLGTFATALSETAYAGGESLPSNAKNGLWNFGATDDADRAPGGITTGVANGTRAVNLYTHLHNNGAKSIQNLTLSYDIEKYRKGNNPAGFAVQLYYSVDGRNWQSAGKDFYTFLTPDNETAGYAAVPGEVNSVEAVLPIDLGKGVDLYLAWNISVASGEAAQGAMALAIDNVRISGELPPIPVTDHYIYVNNLTSWNALGLYAWGDSEIFGEWPGQAPINEIEHEGVTYQVFGLDSDGGNFNLIFNNWNNNKQLPDYNITANRDYWFEIDDNGVKELTVTGVDSAINDSTMLHYDGRHILSGDDNTLKVYNMQGLQVLSGEGPQLDASTLPAGTYIATDSVSAVKLHVK